MSRQAARLRELFDRPGIVRLVGAHSGIGAKLAERAGFDGVWSSGLEISTSYAVPDAGTLTMSEFLAAARSMVEAVEIPVVADCDTGFGSTNNVIRMVRKFEAAGVAAVSIEDKAFPKINSLLPGQHTLAAIPEFVGKIEAAKDAQRSPDFTVIARVEALIAGLGQDEALKRAHAYVKAGADAILIHSKSPSPEPVVNFAHAWDFSVPLVVVPTTYMTITAQELEALGVKMVIYANHGLRASVKAMLDVYRQILEQGSTVGVEQHIAPLSLIFELQDIFQTKKAGDACPNANPDRTTAIIPAASDHMRDPVDPADVDGRRAPGNN